MTTASHLGSSYFPELIFIFRGSIAQAGSDEIAWNDHVLKNSNNMLIERKMKGNVCVCVCVCVCACVCVFATAQKGLH